MSEIQLGNLILVKAGDGYLFGTGCSPLPPDEDELKQALMDAADKLTALREENERLELEVEEVQAENILIRERMEEAENKDSALSELEAGEETSP